jgi:death-on-curing protein
LLGYAKSPPTLTQLGAVYAAGIAQNHPFTDGNKRTALVVCLTFLKLNGVAMSADPGTRYVMFDGLASGSISEKAFAKWLHDFTERVKKLPKAAE